MLDMLSDVEVKQQLPEAEERTWMSVDRFPKGVDQSVGSLSAADVLTYVLIDCSPMSVDWRAVHLCWTSPAYLTVGLATVSREVY